jgi:hypothetical protein
LKIALFKTKLFFSIEVNMVHTSNHSNIATRAVIVALKSPIFGKSAPDIQKILKTPISPATINRIYQRAIKAGFDPKAPQLELQDEWLTDAPKSGRPSL